MENKQEKIFENTCSSEYKKQENPFKDECNQWTVHDSRMLSQLVENITKSKRKIMEELHSDDVITFLDIYQPIKFCQVLKKKLELE